MYYNQVWHQQLITLILWSHLTWELLIRQRVVYFTENKTEIAEQRVWIAVYHSLTVCVCVCVPCNHGHLSSYINYTVCVRTHADIWASLWASDRVFFSGASVSEGSGGWVFRVCVSMWWVCLWRAQPSRTVIRGGGPNYGVTRVQCAALSTADQTLLMGHAGANEHGKTQGGLPNK